VAGLAAGLIVVTVAGAVGISVALVHALARERDAVAARERAERQLYFSKVAQSELRWRANDVRAAAALLADCPPDRRGWEWHYLDGLHRSALARADAESAATAWHPGAGFVDDLTFTADGGRLVTAGGGNPFVPERESGPATVRLWDVATSAPLGPPLVAEAGLRSVVVSPDGQTVAALERTGTVRRWTAADGREVGSVGGMSVVGRLFFHPGGGLRLIGVRNTGGTPHRVAVAGWDAVTGRQLWAYDAVGALASETASGVSVAGNRVAIFLIGVPGGTDRVVTLNADTGSAIDEPLNLSGEPRAIALSADGTRLAVSADRLHVYETATRRLAWSDSVPAPARSLAFSPDGRTLAAGLTDRTVRTWSADRGAATGVWRGNAGRVMALAFHPDGRRLAAAGEQAGGWAVWDLSRPQECILAAAGRGDRSAEGIGFGAGGRELLAVVPTRPLRIVDAQTGMVRDGPAVPISDKGVAPGTLAVVTADGTVVVGPGTDRQTVKVWDAATGAEFASLTGLGVNIQRVAASADGSRVAAAGLRLLPGERPRLACEVRVWDVTSGTVLFAGSAQAGYAGSALALGADGSRVAFTDAPEDATPPVDPAAEVPVRVRVFDVPSGREEWSTTNPAPIWSLTFDGPGRRLAAGEVDGRVYLWDAATGRPLTPAPLTGPGYALAFSPDGTRLAGAGRDQVRLWDAASGEEVFDLPGVPARAGDDGYNPQLAWSPDGRRLAAIRSSGHVAIWDAGPRR
jgi:WD40 repeat protein